MASIYSADGMYITEGLQSHEVCDEAIDSALSLAQERGEDVFLEDGDRRQTVSPDGTIEDGWEGECEL